jgi:hypothetical protein
MAARSHELAPVLGKYRVWCRCPTLRTRPACFSSAIGRCSSRADAPSSPASAAMPSPGWAHTARYSRSPSSETSAERRRLPPLATVVPAAAACAGLRAVTPAGPANARSIASRALRWTAAMCSRTSCSMRWSKSRWPVVSLMPLASHAALRTSTHPVNRYLRGAGARVCGSR